jgi:hypothetical protein
MNKKGMNEMAIRDRGKIKWQPASFIPLAFEMQRSMYKDQERQPKPLIDENQAEVFDQRICYGMQNNLVIKLTVWVDGFSKEVNGRINNIDPITKEIRFEVNPGEVERLNIKDVLEVVVFD